MDRPIWWHYAVLVIPRETRIPDAAMALVVGWNNKATNDPNSVLDRTGNCQPFITTVLRGSAIQSNSFFRETVICD